MTMNRVAKGVFGLGLCAGLAMAGGEPDFGFDFITISDLGNIPITGKGGPLWGRGSVNYEYRIARTEVTSDQYLEFINTFVVQDEEYFSLLRPHASSLEWAVPWLPFFFDPNLTDPANASVQMSWRQAAMYCNWLHNGKSSDPESLMDGVYDVSTFVQDPDTFEYYDQNTHHPDARFWIPTLDEYMKAAFYDPDKGGNGPGWWDYGHSSDEPAVHGLPGVGQVPREVPMGELRDLFGPGIRRATIPLKIYPDVQSPYGLFDVLGGNGEMTEEWFDDFFGDRHHSRMVRKGSNDYVSFVNYDYFLIYGTASPSLGSYGLRIASAVRHPADLNQDWSVNFFDISYFIQRFYAGDLSVDLDGNGSLDFDDVIVFLELVGD